MELWRVFPMPEAYRKWRTIGRRQRQEYAWHEWHEWHEVVCSCRIRCRCSHGGCWIQVSAGQIGILAQLGTAIPLLVVSGPIWLYVGAVYIVLGLVILHGYWSGGGRLTGIAFLAWGIHKADYPVMRSVEWFSPIGFILGSGLQVLVATGMILMHLGQVRERLETDEERLQMIAEHVQDIVYRYRLGPEKGFEYVSPAVTRITGYTPEECYADPDIMAKIVAPEDRERLRAIMSASDLNRIDTVERCVTKRGDSVWLEQRAIVVRDEQGR